MSRPKIKRESHPKPRGRVRHASSFPPQYEIFCQEYFKTNNATVAAIHAGYSPLSAIFLKTRPAIIARLEELSKEFGQKMTELAAKEKYLKEEVMDSRLLTLIFDKDKYVQLRALRMGYQKEKLLPIPGVTINNNNDNKNGNVINGTFKEIYKSRWLREKEAAEGKLLEAEYGSPKLLEGQ